MSRRGVGAVRGAVALLALTLLLTACSSAPSESPQAEESGSAAVAPSEDAEASVEGEAAQDDAGLTLAFAGDVHVEGGLEELPFAGRTTLGPMSRQLRRADVAVVNLESALAGPQVTPTAKELEDASERYWFRSPPAVLDLLARSGVDAASLANNHGADFGRAGLRESLRIARDAPVGVIGVGRDAAQAFAPYRTEVGGTEVAVLAADASPRESVRSVWAAGEGGPGIAAARGTRTAQLERAVRRADRSSDVVAVYLHWGDEGVSCPTGDQQRLAERLAVAGADVVVGAHAHVLLGAGMLDDTYVSYGLGNFTWYNGVRSETGVLEVEVGGDGTVLGDTWHPARVPALGGRPVPVTGAQATDAVADFRRLNRCTELAPPPGVEPLPEPVELPAYASQVDPISPALARRMTGTSFRAGCPVRLGALRDLRVRHVDFDGRARTGRLVVHRDQAEAVAGIFRELYRIRFPIRRMQLIERYGGDDGRSMAADNSSAFNCRTVAGSDTFSRHAFGRAIDLNPVENPYVLPGEVQPDAGRGFTVGERPERARSRPGVILRESRVVEIFERAGWAWGGNYSSPDYQHFYVP